MSLKDVETVLKQMPAINEVLDLLMKFSAIADEKEAEANDRQQALVRLLATRRNHGAVQMDTETQEEINAVRALLITSENLRNKTVTLSEEILVKLDSAMNEIDNKMTVLYKNMHTEMSRALDAYDNYGSCAGPSVKLNRHDRTAQRKLIKNKVVETPSTDNLEEVLDKVRLSFKSIFEETEETTHCICKQPSSGTMVLCDNEQCKTRWFHMACLGLEQIPGPTEEWYCNECSASNV